MKKIIISIITIITALNINAQRVSTQRFMVRKITFNAKDQIVPIKGVSVEINKAKFRSNEVGQFTANVPVAKDLGFYISNIYAPGYIVSIPEDLSKKVYLSSNQFVIVLADINAVKNERNRIYNNNKAALNKQEERLNAEVRKNQELLKKIKNQESEYNAVMAELEKTKRQLESFNNAKADLEAKIDSMSDNLSLVDYASLEPNEQIRLEKDKDGEWINMIVDDVISKFEENLNDKHTQILSEYKNFIDSISNDFYLKYIKGSSPFATYTFTSKYIENDYLSYAINELMEEKSRVLDKMLLSVIEEDVRAYIRKNYSDCEKKWIVELSDHNPYADYTYYHWVSTHFGNFDRLKDVYSDYYLPCKKIAENYVEKYKTIDLDKLTDHSFRYGITTEVEDTIRKKYFELNTNRSIIHNWFIDDFCRLVAEEALEPLRKRYNKFIDHDFKKD